MLSNSNFPYPYKFTSPARREVYTYGLYGQQLGVNAVTERHNGRVTSDQYQFSTSVKLC